MPGGLISNRAQGQYRRSALAPRNPNAPTPVRPQLAESQGHVSSMRGVPINQGTSATGAVAWGGVGVGRLIVPRISKSTESVGRNRHLVQLPVTYESGYLL